MVLTYPQRKASDESLPVFNVRESLRLWVPHFHLDARELMDLPLSEYLAAQATQVAGASSI